MWHLVRSSMQSIIDLIHLQEVQTPELKYDVAFSFFLARPVSAMMLKRQRVMGLLLFVDVDGRKQEATIFDACKHSVREQQ